LSANNITHKFVNKTYEIWKCRKTLRIANHLIFIVKHTYENKYCILSMTTKITMKMRCTKVDQNCPKYTGKYMKINHNRHYDESSKWWKSVVV